MQLRYGWNITIFLQVQDNFHHKHGEEEKELAQIEKGK